MTMLSERKTVYFEKTGEENTVTLLEEVKEYAEKEKACELLIREIALVTFYE